MDAQELQNRLRTTLGLRVGEHTARYILDRLNASRNNAFPVLANHAWTGQPVSRELKREDFDQPSLS